MKFQEVIEGNLVYMIDEIQIQLNHKFLTRSVSFEGMKRIEKGGYPMEALREMLLNALVHRTYMGASVQMRVFDNKLSIWNEGALPMGLTIDNLKEEHNSRPRNPIIADACFKAGYIDTWGRGILKIINSCKEAELPEPSIIEKDGGILVELYTKYAKVDGAVGGVIGGAIGGVMGGVLDEIIEELTEKQRDVLNIISNNNKVSYKEISAILSINESAVSKHISKLKDKSIIERIGGTRGYWKVNTTKNL